MNKNTKYKDILKTGKTLAALKSNITGYLLILPLLIGLIIFTIYPLLLSLYNSFYLDYDGFNNYSEFEFGFGNYIKAFSGYESKLFFKYTTVYFFYCKKYLVWSLYLQISSLIIFIIKTYI